MKIKLLGIFILSVVYITLQSKKSGLANASSRVGTNEGGTNCGTSCHKGGSFTTGATISLTNSKDVVVNKYLPGGKYTVKVELSSNRGAKYGFQSSVLNSSKAQAGSLLPKSANTRVTNLSGKQYAEHSTASATNVFEYSWTAPIKGSGSVDIYTGGVIANGNDMTSMDNGFAVKTTVEEQTSSLSSVVIKSNISYNPSLKVLMANWTNTNIEKVNVYNLNGQLVLTKSYNSAMGVSLDVSSLENALYIVSVQSKDKMDVQKFIKF